jgi:hypothetical protein
LLGFEETQILWYWNTFFFVFFGFLPVTFNSEIMDLIDIWRTPWMGDQPVARPPHTQDNTNSRNANGHPCLEWNLNPQPIVWEEDRVAPAIDQNPMCPCEIRKSGQVNFSSNFFSMSDVDLLLIPPWLDQLDLNGWIFCTSDEMIMSP